MKPLVSILMSIYNEPYNYISESLKSILNQDFNQYELILINDNPDRKEEITSYINSINDNRIVLSHNEKNMGLALSMNKAASLAKTDIFMRMDADDICYPDRITRQFNAITDKINKVDLVFGRYIRINNKSIPISSIVGKLNANVKDWNKTIQLQPSQCIHHPTTMFTREIFEKVGGYRQFPCAQDVDLWLRMAENNCRFISLDDPVIQYRVSSNNTSSRKHFLQQLTACYCYKLSIQRIIHKVDCYSEDNYHNFLAKFGYGDRLKELKFENSYGVLRKSKDCRINKKLVKSWFYKIKAILMNKPLRSHMYDRLHKKMLFSLHNSQKEF